MARTPRSTEAVAAAGDAEVAILCLGERSGLTDDATTGEFRDRSTLGFLGRQQELLEAVVATGTPVVLVVVSGRPLALSWAAEHCAAILLAWVPGEAGPAAIADVLSGDADAAGRLPISMPRHVGQIPLSVSPPSDGWPLQLEGRLRRRTDHAAVDVRVGPVVHDDVHSSGSASTGRAWTRAATRSRSASRSRTPASAPARRSSSCTSATRRRPSARPVRELAGFQRLVLAPGECRTVTFQLSTEEFVYTRPTRRRVVEPGSVTVAVGRSSTDLPLPARFQLVGPTVEVRDRRHYVTETTVE